MWTDVSEERITQSPAARWFLARLIFHFEDGGDTFLRNVGSHTDTRRYIPKDGNIHTYRCENLKSYIQTIVLQNIAFEIRSDKLKWIKLKTGHYVGHVVFYLFIRRLFTEAAYSSNYKSSNSKPNNAFGTIYTGQTVI
jgi:hypothetical protein